MENTQQTTATTTAPATEAVNATPSKMVRCEQIFLAMTEANSTSTRKDILQRFVAEADMTQHGANTYYATLCTKHKGRKGARALREAKPASATVTAKPGSSTTVGGKTAKAKKVAPAAGAATSSAPFSLAVTDEHNKVVSSQPFFSQITAQHAAAQAASNGQSAHVVVGVAEVGQSISMYTSPQIAGQ